MQDIDNSPQYSRLASDVREIGLLLRSNEARTAALARTVQGLSIGAIVDGGGGIPASPVSNLLWNGELGHSVNSWHDSAYTSDDKAKECAHFFSHDAPVAAQTLDATDARTSSTNKTLKASSHSTYSRLFSDWNSTRGEARLTQLTSIDTPLPANFIDATLGTVYASFVLAKRNQWISIPETARLGVGIWDNTAGERDWLSGDLGFDAVASISGATTIERRYRMYVDTDRGYTILSPEVIVATAPDDGEYDANNFVSMSWRAVAGYRKIQLWVYTPSTGVYRLIEEISSGATSFIDNGSFLDTDTGYPSATETLRKSVFYSVTGDLASIATDGSAWSSFSAPIQIPDNYDKSATTDRQWLRIFATEKADLVITGCTTNGTTTIELNGQNALESAYDTDFDAGTLVAKVFDVDGNLLATTTLASRTDDDTAVLGTTIPAGVDRVLQIVGGGFHAILLDKIHLGFQRNVSFAPNPLDVRTLQPVAAPSGSTQGGPGEGDLPGGGGVFCVVEDCPVMVSTDDFSDDFILARDLVRSLNLVGENLTPNVVHDVLRGMEKTRIVRTANGFQKECSWRHKFRRTRFDAVGTSLAFLAVGDPVVTRVNGRDELSFISYIGPLSREKKAVVTPRFAIGGGRYYVAGEWIPKWWEKILIKLRLMKPKTGGIYAHNRKPDPGDEFFF